MINLLHQMKQSILGKWLEEERQNQVVLDVIMCSEFKQIMVIYAPSKTSTVSERSSTSWAEAIEMIRRYETDSEEEEAGPSAYEQMRLDNIRRNGNLLEDLGLNQTSTELRTQLEGHQARSRANSRAKKKPGKCMHGGWQCYRSPAPMGS